MEFSYPAHLELLLPVVIEHTIDERSPLFGHTHDSLAVSLDPASTAPKSLDDVLALDLLALSIS